MEAPLVGGPAPVGPAEAMGPSGQGDVPGRTWGMSVWFPQPPTATVSSLVAFSFFQFALQPFLHRGSHSIFLPVSAGLPPMQINASYLLKNSSVQ